MRRALPVTLVPVLLALLANPSQADARGGGGGFAFAAPAMHVMPAFRSPAIVRHPAIAARQLHRPGLQVPHRQRATQTGFPIGIAPFYADPGFATQVVQAPAVEAAPAQPQVIVINTDRAGHTVAEVAPDFSYVPGCRAIANGYHCDTGGAAH